MAADTTSDAISMDTIKEALASLPWYSELTPEQRAFNRRLWACYNDPAEFRRLIAAKTKSKA